VVHFLVHGTRIGTHYVFPVGTTVVTVTASTSSGGSDSARYLVRVLAPLVRPTRAALPFVSYDLAPFLGFDTPPLTHGYADTIYSVHLVGTHESVDVTGYKGLSVHSATLALSGTWTTLKRALGKLTFQPAPGYLGPATVELTSPDLHTRGPGTVPSYANEVTFIVGQSVSSIRGKGNR
jgi:hypothetical protein